MPDLEQIVRDDLSKNGFDAPPIQADGRIHRFKRYSGDKKEDAWYVCFTNHDSGSDFLAGSYGDWRDGQVHNFCTHISLSPSKKEKIFKKVEKQFEVEQAIRWEETAKDSKVFWENFTTHEGLHAYLVRKKIQNLYSARLSRDHQTLVVPVLDFDGKLWGFQNIDGDGKKLFTPGTKKKSNFCPFGEVEPKETIYLCEGFATACSIFEAIEKPVLACFDAGNLVEVARVVREKYPEILLIVCGDNDVFTENNPGKLKAEEAAAVGLGTFVLPGFKDLSSKPSDFNDLRILEGLSKVQEQVLGVKAFRPILNALGYDKDGNYYYTSSKNKAITVLKTHTKSDLFRLFPFEYWEALYKPEGKGGIQWDRAAATLMDMCHERGIYNPTLQRGYGIWNDAGRIVIHLGDRLWVDGSEVQLPEFKSNFIYELSTHLDSIENDDLTIEEIDPFLKKIQQISFKNHQSYISFLGWIVTSMVAGAIPWRTHIWMKGDRGSGKSSIFEYLNYILASAYRCIYRTQKTTEAHLRGVAGTSVIPILIDEFEGHKDYRESARVGHILDLFRQAASDSEASVGKSSASHKSFSFTVKFSGAVGSITHELEDPADKSRFVMVDFDPPQHSAEEWVQLKRELYSFPPQFFRRLFKRLVTNLPIILANHLALKGAIQSHYGQDARTGDQYGTLLAGYSILHSDSILSAEEAEYMAGMIEWNLRPLPHDAEDRLKWLLGVKIPIDGGYSSVEALYIESCKNIRSHSSAPRWLQLHGFKVMEDSSLFICTEPHGELDKLLAQSPWKRGFTQGLIKLSGINRNVRTRLVGDTKKRGFTIPAHYFADDLAHEDHGGPNLLAQLK